MKNECFLLVAVKLFAVMIMFFILHAARKSCRMMPGCGPSSAPPTTHGAVAQG